MDNFVELSQKLPVIEKISKFGDQWIGLICQLFVLHKAGSDNVRNKKDAKIT